MNESLTSFSSSIEFIKFKASWIKSELLQQDGVSVIWAADPFVWQSKFFTITTNQPHAKDGFDFRHILRFYKKVCVATTLTTVIQIKRFK